MNTSQRLLLPGLLVLASQAAASAQLPPADLTPGEPYRVISVTDAQRDALSTEIADYNAHVAADAAVRPALLVLGTTWTAVCSTETVDARDNTNTDPTPAGSTGVPIYSERGVRIADDYDQLWSGALAAPVTPAGTGVIVWTGTGSSGLAARALGGSRPGFGRADLSDSRWALFGGFGAGGGGPAQRFYGMSDVLFVPPPTMASEASYGIGCSGAGLPPLQLVSGLPVVGTTVTLTARDVPASATMGLLLAGSQPLQPGLDLDVLGATGCSLLVGNSFASLPFPLTGSSATSIRVPGAAGGLQLYWQAAVVAPGTNPLGLITSNGIEWTAGVQ